MKIAYIILAHKNFDQLNRLIDRLSDEDVRFFIHISKTSKWQFYEQSYRALKSKSNCQFVKREKVYWGDFSLVQAILNGIKAVCSHDTNFDFTVILSGQDYPLKSSQKIKSEFEKYRGKQLLEYFTLPYDGWGKKGGMERFQKYHFWFKNNNYRFPPTSSKGVFFDFLIQIISIFLGEERSLPYNLKPYGGATWSVFSLECIEYISNFVDSKEGKRLKRYFRYTWGSCEMFFQTVIMNSQIAETVIWHYLSYCEFPEEKGGHTRIFTSEDSERLLSTKCLFARKFDMDVDSEILDIIDRSIEKSVSSSTSGR